MPIPSTIVLVHGWSVHNTNTYGGLPQLLRHEGFNVEHVWLGKYVSFQDEVRLEDLAQGFEAAVQGKLANILRKGERFACVTHSTGGPVVRLWWDEYYHRKGIPCPMSHLVMLAPANFGSALSQLGRSHLSRISKKLLEGVEPGTGVLDWLELGSPEAWTLNMRWITEYDDPTEGDDPVFPFVLTGQTINRKLYDHLNSYTAELGSDGVVRVAAANLNSAYLKLDQPSPRVGNPGRLVPRETRRAPATAFALIRGRSHSGAERGILRSIPGHPRTRHPTVKALLHCLRVSSPAEYRELRLAFEKKNRGVRESERVEVEQRGILPDRKHIHDSGTMIILKLVDDHGHPVEDFEFTITGPGGSPDRLPAGFFIDRQRNSRRRNTLTYYLNHDTMMGSGEVSIPGGKQESREVLREALAPLPQLGMLIVAQPTEGYVHFSPTGLGASARNLDSLLGEDQTTLVEVQLHRTVREGMFVLTDKPGTESFKNQGKGKVL